MGREELLLKNIIERWTRMGKYGEYAAKKNQVCLLLDQSYQNTFTRRIARQHLPFYKRYIFTVTYSTKMLNSAGIDFTYIKLFRSYSFYDTNIDILLPKELWGDAFKIFKQDGWRLPNPLKRLEQNMIEKGKIKLYPPTKQYVILHFYDTGSWRGFEYLPISTIYDNSMEIKKNGTKFKISTYEMDFLINCAHIIFENYQLTLGELYHLKELQKHANMPNKIPKQQGWEKTIEIVKDIVEKFWHSNSNQVLKMKLPHPVPIEKLMQCWTERFAFKCRQGNFLLACFEIATHLFWRNTIRIYKKLKY